MIAAPGPAAADQAGLAHVATASFLASRVVPTGGFVVALAGGVALARATLVAGTRAGYGASVAATLQTVAVLGPSRFGVPLTQALSAPLLGRLQARGAGAAAQFAACAAVRALDGLLTALFYIAIIVGGIDAYAATYDALVSRVPGLPDGVAAALLATAAGLAGWTLLASTVQVLVYRAALRGWPDEGAVADQPDAARGHRRPLARAPRFDPRIVAVSALVAFVALVVTTAWLLLAAVAAWLAVAWATARGDREPVRAGLALAALLGGGALAFGLVGGSELDVTLQRAVRAALLVLVATWLRVAAGEEGLREVARRSLMRARRLPAMREAAVILEQLGETGALSTSARALVADVRDGPRRPAAVAAAVLRWVAAEAARFAPPVASVRAQLRVGHGDRALVGALVLAAAGALASL